MLARRAWLNRSWLPVALTVALIVYLPLEAVPLSFLQGPLYWALRLAPDIAIVAVAAVVVLSPMARQRRAMTLVWAVVAVCSAAILLYGLRGQTPEDTINALRVVVRYLVLGALVWAATPDDVVAVRWFIRSICVAAAIQFGVVSVQVLQGIAQTGGHDIGAILGPGGTLGRYDRLGLMMTAPVLLAITHAAPRARMVAPALAMCGLAGLALSTSRQAMLGLMVAALLLALLPRITLSERFTRGLVAAAAVAFLALIPASAPASAQPVGDGDGATSPSPAAQQTEEAARVPRGGFTLSAAPTSNWRLYLTLVLVPWALSEEPLFGFGPGQNDAAQTDPRLEARVAKDQIDWSRATAYMNDSNYASLVLQFGVVLPALFGAVMAGLALGLLRFLLRSPPSPWIAFALAYSAVVVVAAAFGPSFEIRTVSLLMWVGLFGGRLVASRSRS